MISEVFVLDAVRTPFGRYGGALSGVRPDDLAAGVLGALGERNDLDPSLVDEVILGDANGAGEDNRNVARMAALLAGWPTSIPASTVNRLCGSGLDAVMGASRSIAATVATAVCDTVKTRSSAPMPQARKASSIASVPLAQPIPWARPRKRAKSLSKRSATGPRIY